MTQDEWRELLKRCSGEMLKADLLPGGYEPSMSERESQWLGFPPASHESLRAAEDRLRISLSPSLRTFYLVTNGWRSVGCFIYEVLPVEQIHWLKEVNENLWALADSNEQEGQTPWDRDHIVEYERWISDQGTRVKRSLVIALEGDASTWLLDPGTVNSDGEWFGGRWSSWNPAMDWIADSFTGLFVDEFETYLKLRSEETEPIGRKKG